MALATGSYLFVFILLAVLWCIPKTREAMRKGSEETRRLSYQRNKRRFIEDIDEMSGEEFEKFSVKLLEAIGFWLVEKTKTSGDYGAFSGAKMYRADVAAVITNSLFTPNARKMAKEIGVLLIDRDRLEKLMKKAELGLSVDDLN